MAAVSAETTQSDVQALGPMTDRRYIASLKDNREVRIDGKQVSDVSTHPAFRGTIAELARVYATSRAVGVTRTRSKELLKHPLPHEEAPELPPPWVVQRLPLLVRMAGLELESDDLRCMDARHKAAQGRA